MILDDKQWEGWPWAAEPEFAEFVGSLLKLIQPGLVVETGLGSGAIARAASPWAKQYICYENVPKFWENLPEGATCGGIKLDQHNAAIADVTILDSLPIDLRIAELQIWAEHAKPEAIVIVHDADHGIQRELTDAIEAAGLPGVYLTHPARSFIGQARDLASIA